MRQVHSVESIFDMLSFFWWQVAFFVDAFVVIVTAVIIRIIMVLTVSPRPEGIPIESIPGVADEYVLQDTRLLCATGTRPWQAHSCHKSASTKMPIVPQSPPPITDKRLRPHLLPDVTCPIRAKRHPSANDNGVVLISEGLLVVFLLHSKKPLHRTLRVVDGIDQNVLLSLGKNERASFQFLTNSIDLQHIYTYHSFKCLSQSECKLAGARPCIEDPHRAMDLVAGLPFSEVCRQFSNVFPAPALVDGVVLLIAVLVPSLAMCILLIFRRVTARGEEERL